MPKELKEILAECMRGAESIEDLAERLTSAGVVYPPADNAECKIRNAELRVAWNLIGEIEAFASKNLLILELLNPEKSGVAAGGKHAIDLLLELLAKLKKKYTEGKK